MPRPKYNIEKLIDSGSKKPAVRTMRSSLSRMEPVVEMIANAYDAEGEEVSSNKINKILDAKNRNGLAAVSRRCLAMEGKLGAEPEDFESWWRTFRSSDHDEN